MKRQTPYLLFCNILRPYINKNYKNISLGETGYIISSLYEKLTNDEKILYNTELTIISPSNMDILYIKANKYIDFFKKLREQITSIYSNEDDLFINTKIIEIFKLVDKNEFEL